jgi:methylated-DNA-[protein]-cysteine S-methyltransferase
MIVQRSVLRTPIGRLTLYAKGGALAAVFFEKSEEQERLRFTRRLGDVRIETHPDPAGAVSALRDYFEGDLGALDGIPVVPAGTEFQRAVWSALREIPAGATMSYSGLAARLDRPSAVRAVGAANGSNPVPVVIPCHRVVAASGALWGYGGGLAIKRWLLTHEKALPPGAERVPASPRIDGERPPRLPFEA